MYPAPLGQLCYLRKVEALTHFIAFASAANIGGTGKPCLKTASSTAGKPVPYFDVKEQNRAGYKGLSGTNPPALHVITGRRRRFK